MGKIIKHNPVKLIVGFIFKEEPVFEKVRAALSEKFGRIDFESQTLPFCYTDYYEKELGKDLRRKFIAFKKLISAGCLAKIKVITNKIEERFSRDKTRTINIDPGYLDLAKLVLASTKDYKHRIYLDKGVLAEITLFFQDKSFKAWEWTYPDYCTAGYIAIFNKIREIYQRQIV